MDLIYQTVRTGGEWQTSEWPGGRPAGLPGHDWVLCCAPTGAAAHELSRAWRGPASAAYAEGARGAGPAEVAVVDHQHGLVYVDADR